MRVHPRCYFIVICARGDKLSQRFCFQASSGKKLAIKRAVVLVRAALAEQFRPALIDQSSRHRRELLAQRCVRAARCTAFQVGSHGAQFFSVHYAMIITQEFRPVEDASNPTSFLTHGESTPPHDSTRVREGENFHGRFLRSEDFSPQNCATRRNSVKVGLVRLAYEKHAAQSHEKVRKSSLGN